MTRKASTSRHLSPTQRKRLYSVARLLAEAYGPHIFPDEKDAMGKMLFAILVSQTAVTNARKAMREFREMALDWNELRVHSVREIEEALARCRIAPAGPLATLLKRFMQASFDALCTMRLEVLAQARPEVLKGYLQAIGFLPPYLVQYLRLVCGLDSTPPLDPATERILERIGIFEPGCEDAEARRAALGAVLEDPLHFHHLMHEHGRKLCTPERPRCSRCVVYEHCAYPRSAQGSAEAAAAAEGGGAAARRRRPSSKQKAARAAARSKRKGSKRAGAGGGEQRPAAAARRRP
ncbi:MAG: hypothetical protein KatS3mg102_0918 [Planctomycetota bacterium]|nr:MAG: hypothetical protein KatS3mg102_0918 [Planctomycetota bacterium]